MTAVLTTRATCDAEGTWTRVPAILERTADGQWRDRPVAANPPIQPAQVRK